MSDYNLCNDDNVILDSERAKAIERELAKFNATMKEIANSAAMYAKAIMAQSESISKLVVLFQELKNEEASKL